MKDLNIGIIGAGGRGRFARTAHDPDNGVRVVAGADVNPKALEQFAERFGEDALLTEDYQEILKRDDIDAVFVTTPDFLHEEHAVAALEAGKAVYLEKPMAITIEGCDRLLETARNTGSKLYLGHNMRHFPVVLKMKEIIDSGVIGPIQAVWCRHFVGYGGDAYFKDWHSERQYSTSLLLQKGAHDIDVIHWLAGGHTRRVVGMGRLSVYDQCDRRASDEPGNASWSADNWPPLSQKGLSPVIDVEDHNTILMSLENGVQCVYAQCHYTPDSSRNYTFIGTNGRIENMGDHGECQIYHYDTRRGGFGKPDHVHNLWPLAGSHGGSDPNIVKEFVAFVRQGIPTNTSPVAARHSVATGVMGAESIRSGNEPRDIPQLDPDLVAYFENGQKA